MVGSYASVSRIRSAADARHFTPPPARTPHSAGRAGLTAKSPTYPDARATAIALVRTERAANLPHHARLLTTIVDMMGGAPTSLARGDVLSVRI